MTSPCEILAPEAVPEGRPQERTKRWRAFLEVYPEEALLRIRVDGRTAVLEPLTPLEVAYARGTPAGLEEIAVAHLKAAAALADLPSREGHMPDAL
jgi:hypothetical protein